MSTDATILPWETTPTCADTTTTARSGERPTDEQRTEGDERAAVVSLLSLFRLASAAPFLPLTWGKGIVAVHPLSVDEVSAWASVALFFLCFFFPFVFPFPPIAPSQSVSLLGLRGRPLLSAGPCCCCRSSSCRCLAARPPLKLGCRHARTSRLTARPLRLDHWGWLPLAIVSPRLACPTCQVAERPAQKAHSAAAPSLTIVVDGRRSLQQALHCAAPLASPRTASVAAERSVTSPASCSTRHNGYSSGHNDGSEYVGRRDAGPAARE